MQEYDENNRYRDLFTFPQKTKLNLSFLGQMSDELTQANYLMFYLIINEKRVTIVRSQKTLDSHN